MDRQRSVLPCCVLDAPPPDCCSLLFQMGIFNHVSYLDAFVVVWAFCVAGVTFQFSRELPVLGLGVRALQNLYVPKESDKSKQQTSMVEAIKARYEQL